MCSNTNLAHGGSDLPTCPAPNRVLGGSNLGASKMTSPIDITMVALDQADWRAPLLAYLLEEVFPLGRTEARRIARRAKTFISIGDELYKRSPSGVLMKCIPTDQGKQLLLEVHAGICIHHVAMRSLVGKAFRQGFY